MAAQTTNSMDTRKTLVIILFIFSKSISGQDDLNPTSCNPTEPHVEVRWPFCLRDRQPVSCGFPGFDLTCNNKNETLLHLHSSQSFVVNHISYLTQEIIIEPNFCLPERINDINLTGTPFDLSMEQRYTFFNCSSQMLEFTLQNVKIFPIPCLGSVNHSVFAVPTIFIPHEANCTVMKTISVPISHYGDISNELTLRWFIPFMSDGSSSHGSSKGAKYALSIGVLCVLGLILYVFCQVRRYNRGQHQNIDLLSIAITTRPPSTTGLDGPTIQSYPKSVLGESCRFPTDDGSCPICLSDYKSNESVRTIPKCSHYFHLDCIDEWLKLNATCPVCRIAP